jgi:outer membrane protein
MRGLTPAVLVASALASTHALAQYENHALSLSVGYVALHQGVVIVPGIAGGVGWTDYIDGGFEWTANADAMLLPEPDMTGNIFGVSGGPGLRYLFLQESIRPWVGVALGYLLLFRSDQSWSHLGLGPSLGLDVFLTRQISLGLKVRLDFYGVLRDRDPISLQISSGGALVASAWF